MVGASSLPDTVGFPRGYLLTKSEQGMFAGINPRDANPGAAQQAALSCPVPKADGFESCLSLPSGCAPESSSCPLHFSGR